jgi:hypothetical protein
VQVIIIDEWVYSQETKILGLVGFCSVIKFINIF